MREIIHLGYESPSDPPFDHETYVEWVLCGVKKNKGTRRNLRVSTEPMNVTCNRCMKKMAVAVRVWIKKS